MEEINQITLKEYRKVLKAESTFFQESYKKLQLGEKLNNTEIFHLLKNAIIFFKFW